MKVALIQTNLIWENPAQNRSNFEEKINTIASDVDLVVLPEMFTTGFSMHPETLAESMQGETVLWLQHLAKAKNKAMTGSIIIKEKGNFYNRMVFVFPSGEIEYYDKRHLFSLAGEDERYSAGAKKQIVTYKGWKICLQVCYDLRFPVFARNTEDYDVLIYAANWPTTRILAWDILLRARAIENMCYAIGVNRIGEDGNGHPYSGHSQMVDFLGNMLVGPSSEEAVLVATLDKTQIMETRKKLDFLSDRDFFEIKGLKE